MEQSMSSLGSPNKMQTQSVSSPGRGNGDDMSGDAGFRASEIAFLQEQNQSVLSALENIEAERDNTLRLVREWEDKEQQMLVETANVQKKIKILQDGLIAEKTELISKDEHVRVLSQQNQQMLELLEAEELRTKETSVKIQELAEENANLKILEVEFDKIKDEIESLIKAKKDETITLAHQLREFRQLNESLRADIASVDAQTQVDIEALNQVLAVVSNKNVEYMQQLQKQDTREQQLNEELAGLRDTAAQLKKDIEQMKRHMDGDEEERNAFERDKASLQQKIEALESKIDVLKRTLNTAEKANEQLHDENRRSSEKFREMADKVYGLMDSLRLNQVELKRMEAENVSKQKKFVNVEKLIANIQSKISMELDAKNIAEQEKRDADQESALLKRKNKKIEESISTAQNVQEQVGKHIVELNEQINALQTQNAYLASRIDGQEEEKNSLKGEIKKGGERFTEMTKTNNQLREEIDKLDIQLAELRELVVNLRAELDYVKREDVLDETGRQRPILIQSNESTLLEKLQVNEFLYESQQNKNPVPSLVEKLAQLLELLHTSQSHCDQYLGDLAKSNSLVSALRQKNLVLFEKTSMFESFKTRALVRYMMNLFESGNMQSLNLDGLFFTSREIQELINLLTRYNVKEKVFFISLAENGLTDDAINIVLQLIMTPPYLKALDLRRNAFTGEGIQKINEQCRVIEGVTSVIKSATGQINIHSGNQLRLCIEISDQNQKYTEVDPTDGKLNPNFNVKDADNFLQGPSGLTTLAGQDMFKQAMQGEEEKSRQQNGQKLPAVQQNQASQQDRRPKAKGKAGAARKNIPPPLHVLHKKREQPPTDFPSFSMRDRASGKAGIPHFSQGSGRKPQEETPPPKKSLAMKEDLSVGGWDPRLNLDSLPAGPGDKSSPWSPLKGGKNSPQSEEKTHSKEPPVPPIGLRQGPDNDALGGAGRRNSRRENSKRIPNKNVLDKWQTGNYDPYPMKVNNFMRPDSTDSSAPG